MGEADPEGEVAHRRTRGGRVAALVALAVAVLLVPGVLSTTWAKTRLESADLTDTKSDFVELSLANAAGVRSFVPAGKRSAVRFEMQSRLSETADVTWRATLVPDDGGRVRELRTGESRLAPGDSEFAVLRSKVPCTSRSRVVIAAAATGAPTTRISFHVYPYKTGGVTLCTSNPGAGDA